jgi:sugar phosphate isomerase/epimerase
VTVRQGFGVGLNHSLDDAMAFAADRGFDFVELNMQHAFAPGRVEVEAVRETAAAHGVDVLAHLPYSLDPASPHEHVREGACRELEASVDAALGADRGVYHGTTLVRPETWDDDTLRENLYATVRRVTDHARDRGFDAVVENLKDPFFDAGDFPDLLAATDANACLDTGHAHVTGQDPTAQATLLRDHGDRVTHVHLNDTRRDETDEHLPVGLGKLDFAPLADAMRETGWSGTVTHELFGFDLEYAAHGKRAFDRLLDGE